MSIHVDIMAGLTLKAFYSLMGKVKFSRLSISGRDKKSLGIMTTATSGLSPKTRGAFLPDM